MHCHGAPKRKKNGGAGALNAWIRYPKQTKGRKKVAQQSETYAAIAICLKRGRREVGVSQPHLRHSTSHLTFQRTHRSSVHPSRTASSHCCSHGPTSPAPPSCHPSRDVSVLVHIFPCVRNTNINSTLCVLFCTFLLFSTSYILAHKGPPQSIL